MIPPYAPAQGGAWEAMVKQIKHVIANILEKLQRRPSFVELLTYVGSAIKIVNDRPLTPLSDDPREWLKMAQNLRPGQLVILTSMEDVSK